MNFIRLINLTVKPTLNNNHTGLKVMLLLLVYLMVSSTHIFFMHKTVPAKKHNYNSIFKRESENAINLQRVDKSTVNQSKKSYKGIIKNIKLFFTVLLFEPGACNLNKEQSPPNNQPLSSHHYNHLDCCIIRV